METISTPSKLIPELDIQLLQDDRYPYCPVKLYFGYYKNIPIVYEFEELDKPNWKQGLKKEFKDNVLIHNSISSNKKGKEIFHEFYLLEEEILFAIYDQKVILCCQVPSIKLVQRLLQFLRDLNLDAPDMAEINLIISEKNTFENRKVRFKKKDISLEKLFNNDFLDFHFQMTSFLKEKEKSGLHLLHGIPGTGKSTYLKYLACHLEKKMIFLSGQMAQNLDSVFMTRYLIMNSNSILVIEDAEELIISRSNQRNSNLAMILNLTDGILGESLGIQIIATFNTDLKNIDPALLRKGRLKSSYEFKELAAEKTNELLKEEGVNYSSSVPMTLADIFNYKENNYKGIARQAVGFKVNNIPK